MLYNDIFTNYKNTNLSEEWLIHEKSMLPVRLQTKLVQKKNKNILWSSAWNKEVNQNFLENKEKLFAVIITAFTPIYASAKWLAKNIFADFNFYKKETGFR